MNKAIDLNCDMGEGIGNEAALLPYISSASIACGYHAGDEATMKATVDLCVAHNVAIGAHPSFPDRANFGRSNMILPPAEIKQLVATQILALEAIVKNAGVRLQHVKPHGALYNMAAKDLEMATAIVAAIQEINPELILFGLPASCLEIAARTANIPFVGEGFADRTYQADGSLTPRSQPDAMVENETLALAQALEMVERKLVHTPDGLEVPLEVGTICLHGDGGHALAFAKAIREGLQKSGIHIHALR